MNQIDGRQYPQNKNMTCPVCGSTDLQLLLGLPEVPVYCNLLCETYDEAVQVPRANLSLLSCNKCGHSFNGSFDSSLLQYSDRYENSLSFSPRFQEYTRSLAERLVERYGLYHKDVIEIGCGQGDFLVLVCRIGENRGLGFDPSYRGGSESPGVTIIKDYYSERYSGYNADMIVCRQVLEHIVSPRKFLLNLYNAIGTESRSVVFFEVPNFLFTLRDMGIWDLIYEHCHYFTIQSLNMLFSQCGFHVLSIEETYGSQFLTIEAVNQEDFHDSFHLEIPPVEMLANYTASFFENFNVKMTFWKKRLNELRAKMEKTVLWGAGSKGVTFLNVLAEQTNIEYVVDVNTRKVGMHIAGTGQKIVSPEFLEYYKPQTVLVMNPLYFEEISEQVQRKRLTTKCVQV